MSHPIEPIVTAVQDLGVGIHALKKRLDAVESNRRIDHENQLDILVQRQRALIKRLDAMPDTDTGSLPADIPREVAELKRAVARIDGSLSMP